MADHSNDFPVFNRVVAQSDLIDQMMERTFADPLVAIRHDSGISWHEARWRCVACDAAEQCGRWLASTSSDNCPDVPEFCANGAFIQSCRRPGKHS